MPEIIFDCDMGHSIDDVLALAMLYGFSLKRQASVISVDVTNSSLDAAVFCDVLARFYNAPLNRGFKNKGQTQPVGLAKDRPESPNSSVLKAATSKSIYARRTLTIYDTAEPASFIRNSLTAEYDGTVVVVLTGPASTLAKLLSLDRAKELIAKKVRLLSIATGGLGGDVPAAKKLFAEWPTPIVTCGADIGDAVMYPADSIQSDFAWTENHPVVDAYRAFRPMPYDAPTSAMAAALYAVRPEDNFFSLSEGGTGRHRQLILNEDRKAALASIYRQMVSAPIKS